jgi:hypothetical protein
MNPKRARRLQTMWWVLVLVLVIYVLLSSGELRGAWFNFLNTGGLQPSPITLTPVANAP